MIGHPPTFAQCTSLEQRLLRLDPKDGSELSKALNEATSVLARQSIAILYVRRAVGDAERTGE